jgi:hypothetical protein
MQYVGLPRYDNGTSSVAAELLVSAGSSSASKCHIVAVSACAALKKKQENQDLWQIKRGVVTYTLQVLRSSIKEKDI